MPSREKLTDNLIDEQLALLGAGWSLKNQHLYKKFKFKDFAEAFSFMTYVALHSERLDHHPNWSNVYNIVEIELFTHDSAGITELDFRLAKICEAF